MSASKSKTAFRLILEIAALRTDRATVQSLRPYLPNSVPFNEVIENLAKQINRRIKRLTKLK